MTEDSSGYFTLNALAGLTFLAIIATVWIRVYRRPIVFWWHLMKARLPVAGTNRRHQANPAMRTPLRGDNQIAPSESALVAAVLPEVGRGLSKSSFEDSALYISKSEDGNIQTHAAPVLMTFALVLAVVEGWSASFVVLPWLGVGVTGATLDAWAGVAGYGLAMFMAIAAHKAGELSRRARFAHRHWVAYQEGGMVGNFNPREILLNEDQRQDDGAPAFEQFRARVQTSFGSSLPRLMFAGLMVFGLMLVTLRGVGLAEEEARQAAFAAQIRQQQGDAGQTAVPLTSAVGSSIGQTLGGTIALGLFLLAYVGSQAVAFAAGSSHGFNGSRSAEAFKLLRGHTSYEAYLLEREAAIAKLEPVFAHLQAGQQIRGRTHTPTLREVIAYLDAQKQRPDDQHLPPPPPAQAKPDVTPHRFGRSGVSAMRGDLS